VIGGIVEVWVIWASLGYAHAGPSLGGGTLARAKVPAHQRDTALRRSPQRTMMDQHINPTNFHRLKDELLSQSELN